MNPEGRHPRTLPLPDGGHRRVNPTALLLSPGARVTRRLKRNRSHTHTIKTRSPTDTRQGRNTNTRTQNERGATTALLDVTGARLHCLCARCARAIRRDCYSLAVTRYSFSSRPLYENQYYYSQTPPLFGHPTPPLHRRHYCAI